MEELAAIFGNTHAAELKMTGGHQKTQEQTALSKLKVDIKEVGHQKKVVEVPSGFNITHAKMSQNVNEVRNNSGNNKIVCLKRSKLVKKEVLENLDQDEITNGPEIP